MGHVISDVFCCPAFRTRRVSFRAHRIRPAEIQRVRSAEPETMTIANRHTIRRGPRGIVTSAT